MSGASELGAEKPTRKGPEPLRSRQIGVLGDVDRSPCSNARARSRAQSSKACWGPVAARARERRTETGTSRGTTLRLHWLQVLAHLHPARANDPAAEHVRGAVLLEHLVPPVRRGDQLHVHR